MMWMKKGLFVTSVVMLLASIATWAVLQAAISGGEAEQAEEITRSRCDLGEGFRGIILAAAQAQERQRETRLAEVGSRIDTYLAGRGSPLAGYGRVFAEEAEKTGINPYLSVAIAGKESSFGLHCFSPHNAWGMLTYKLGFTSWEEGIRANFTWLKRYYGTPQSAYDCPGYCVPDHPWMEHVQAFIRELEVGSD
jgi:hypothetical protein